MLELDRLDVGRRHLRRRRRDLAVADFPLARRMADDALRNGELGERHVQPKRDAAGGGRRRADDELPPREVLALAECHLSHGALPYDLLPVVAPPAAMWTASRMR